MVTRFINGSFSTVNITESTDQTAIKVATGSLKSVDELALTLFDNEKNEISLLNANKLFGSNTVIVKRPEDFGTPDINGCITLEGDSTGKTFILQERISMPSELKIRGVITIWDPTQGANQLTFTGAKAFKSDGDVLADLSIIDARVELSSTTQLFDLDLLNGTFGNFRGGINGGGSIGRIDNASLINNVNSSWTNFRGGWTVDNVGIFALQGQVFTSAGFTTPGPLLRISGTVGRLIDITRTIWVNFFAGNSIFDFDSNIVFGTPFGVHSIILVNNQVNPIVGATVFVPGSIQTDDPRMISLAVGGMPTSASIGLMSMTGNVVSTVIATQGVDTDILGVTAAGIDNERFTHAISPNVLTYIGLSDVKLTVHISLSGKRTAGAGARRITVTLYQDTGSGFVAVPDAVTGTDFDNRDTGLSFTIITKVSTNDKFKVQIANVDGTEDMTITDFIFSIND